MAHAMVQAAAPSVRLAGREPCGGWAAPRVPTARSRPVSAVSTPSEYRVINNRSEQFLESVALAADVLTDVQFEAGPKYFLPVTMYRTRVAKAMACQAFRGAKYSVIVARDASAGDRIVGVVDVRQRSAQPWIAASLDRRFGPEACSSGSYFEISNLAVLPQYRRQGHGRALIRQAEECVRLSIDRQGLLPPEGAPEAPAAAPIVLYMYKDNEGARELYEQEGYELVEEYEDLDWLESVDKGRMPVRPRKVMYVKLAQSSTPAAFM